MPCALGKRFNFITGPEKKVQAFKAVHSARHGERTARTGPKSIGHPSDADYCRAIDWLKDLVPVFARISRVSPWVAGPAGRLSAERANGSFPDALHHESGASTPGFFSVHFAMGFQRQ